MRRRPAATRSRRSRATARRTGCGSSPRPRAYDWYYNVVANPTLWFLQHYLWALAVLAGHRPGASPRLGRRVRPGQPSVRRRGPRRARRAARRAPSSSTTTTCISRRGSSATPRPDASLAHFVHIPWPQPDLLACAARADPARDPRRAARERRRRLPRRSLAAELPALEPRPARRRVRLRLERLLVRAAGGPSSPRVRSRSTRPSSRSSRQSEPVLRLRGGARVAPARVAGPPRRPHGSRRRTSSAASGRSSSTSMPHPEMHGRVGDARAPRPVPPGHSGVRRVPRRDPARGADGQRPLPARTAGCRSTCGSRTTSRCRLRRTSSTTCCS